jgi:hypothetical protein
MELLAHGVEDEGERVFEKVGNDTVDGVVLAGSQPTLVKNAVPVSHVDVKYDACFQVLPGMDREMIDLLHSRSDADDPLLHALIAAKGVGYDAVFWETIGVSHTNRYV